MHFIYYCTILYTIYIYNLFNKILTYTELGKYRTCSYKIVSVVAKRQVMSKKVFMYTVFVSTTGHALMDEGNNMFYSNMKKIKFD